MNDTIDTLKIKVEGESESAVKKLDDVISALERIKGAGSGRSLSALNNHLSKLSATVNNIKSKNLSRLVSFFSTMSSIQKISISAKLPERIKEIGESVRSLDGTDFSQLNRMADGLNALSGVQNARAPKIQVDNPAKRVTTSSGSGYNGSVNLPSREVVDKTDVALKEANIDAKKFSERISDITGKFRKVRNSTKEFGDQVKTSFSDTIVGRFLGKIKETITSLGRIALYRFMRTLIKQVTGDFKTGIDDMYQYSKTFNGNYAQSMDQLASANLTFKNSIGAMIAPLIELVTPWLDSVLTKLVEVNNTIAMVFASLAGKTTYSKAVRVTTEYAEAATKAGDETDKVKKKVEELKRSLAGLDEITIIGKEKTSPLSSTTDLGKESGLDYGSMFVEAPVDTAKVKEILDTLNSIWDVAKWIGIAIAAWEFAKFLMSIGEVLTGLNNINQKILGLTMIIVGFGLEFSGSFHIGYGDATLKDYIMTALGAALGIAGSLLVFGTNPVGWTIGIAAAVAVAVTGISVGMNQRLSDVVEEAFYDAGGTITISDLAGQFERYMTALTDSYQPTIDLGIKIDEMRNEHLAPTVTEIEGIASAITNSKEVTDEQVDEIKKKFEYLYDNSKGVLQDTRDLIINSIAGGFGETLTALGIDIPEVMALVNGTTAEMETQLEEWHGKVDKLSEQFNSHSISAEEYSEGILKLTEEYRNLMGISDPITDAFYEINQSIEDGIDWQDKDMKNSAFAKIKESSDTAMAAVDEMIKQLKEKLGTLRDNAKNEEERTKYADLIAGTDAYRESERKKIASAVEDLGEKVQADMLLKLGHQSDELKQKYAKEGFITKLVHSEDSYVAAGLEEYNRNVIKPITDELKKRYKKVGADGSIWASDAASEIISGMFTIQNHSGNGLNTLIAGSAYNLSAGVTKNKGVLEAIEDYYEKTGKAMPIAVANGITSEKEKSLQAWTKLRDNLFQPFLDPKNRAKLSGEAKEVIDAFFKSGQKTSEVNSPSKRSQRLMGNIMLGLIPSENSKSLVISSFESMLNTLFGRLETFTNRWRGAINTMFDDMAFGWKNADFRSDGSYNFKYLSNKSIQRFAEGGFPEDGLFYANHNEIVGQFRNGKTAVANNEQIVEGIAGGVAAANEEQNRLLREQNRLLKRLLEKDSSIDVSTIASAFNRKNQRDGKVTVPVSV